MVMSSLAEGWEQPAFLEPIHKFGEELSTRATTLNELMQIPPHGFMRVTGIDDLGTACWVFVVYMSFGCGLLLSLIDSPFLRKWFSSSVGMILGFFIYGPGYVWCLAMFLTVYIFLAVLPREAGAKVGQLIAFVYLALANLYVFWLGRGKTDFTFAAIICQHYVKLHMTLCNYADAGKLSDPKKKTELTNREVKEAEALV